MDDGKTDVIYKKNIEQNEGKGRLESKKEQVRKAMKGERMGG